MGIATRRAIPKLAVVTDSTAAAAAPGDLLVAAPLAWDEATFAVPTLRGLLSTGLRIAILHPESQSAFWATLPGIHRIPYPDRAWRWKIAGILRQNGPWKASLVWEPGPAARALALAGIPERLGPALPALRHMITRPIPLDPDPRAHRVHHYLAATEALGLEEARSDWFAPADSGIPQEPGTLLVSPASDFGPSHEWPLDSWRSLLHGLAALDLRITLADARLPQDRSPSPAGILATEFGLPLFPFHPPADALPLLAVHPHVLAADGSLPHLAAHMGATCLTLFGPNDPTWKRPLGRRHHVFRHQVECAPCLLAKCALDLRCQHELDPEAVLATTRQLLAATTAPSSRTATG